MANMNLKRLLSLCLVCLCLCLTGCRQKAEPAVVVEKAVSYLVQGDLENYFGCYRMTTESRVYLRSVYREYLSGIVEERGGVSGCTILSKSFSRDNQTAYVVADLHFGDGSSSVFYYTLKLFDGRWKIILNK